MSKKKKTTVSVSKPTSVTGLSTGDFGILATLSDWRVSCLVIVLLVAGGITIMPHLLSGLAALGMSGNSIVTTIVVVIFLILFIPVGLLLLLGSARRL